MLLVARAGEERFMISVEMAPGQGVAYDLPIPAPGQNAFVDHRMRDMSIGAAGLLNVTP